MAVYKIVKYPAVILRKKAKTVKDISAPQRELLDNMVETMYSDEVTVGLAAQQVNLDIKLIVIDARDKVGLIKLINPVIKSKEGELVSMEEGCMSLPGITVPVLRSPKVVVEAKNERGQSVNIEAEGFLARVLQHEIDHLKGKLIIDYLHPAKKALFNINYRLKKKVF
jgi:peptide deformylase